MKKIIKAFLVLLIIAVYAGTLINALMVTLVDDKIIEELQEGVGVSVHFSMDTIRETYGRCIVPECGRQASKQLSCCIESSKSRFINIFLPDEKFDIETGSFEQLNTKQYTKHEKYLLIQQVKDGTYKASIEDEYNKVTVSDGTTTTYYFADVSCLSCETHGKESKSILLDEVGNAIKSTTFYVWSKTLFPWNLVALTWILTFVNGFWLYAGTEPTKIDNSVMKGFFVVTVILALLLICISVLTSGQFWFYVCVVLGFFILIFGALLFALFGEYVGNCVALLKNKKEGSIELQQMKSADSGKAQ